MTDRANVPCDGCTACCRNDLLILHPEMGDDPTQYETQRVINPITGRPALALKHKPGGGCLYLGPGGCMIWDRAPAICREFDCRKLFMELGKRERKAFVKAGLFGSDVIEAGRSRLHTLKGAA